MQRDKPASLVQSAGGCAKWPSHDNGGVPAGTTGWFPFVLRLGGPFGAVVSGRLSPIHLLSEPSSSTYSSSS